MGYNSSGYVPGGVALDAAVGAPSTGVTTKMSSTFSASTPGSVGDPYSHCVDSVELAGHASGDFYSLSSASVRALEMTHDSSGCTNEGNAFSALAMGKTTTMANNLSASASRFLDDHDPYANGGVYGTRYPNVNRNPSNNALPSDIRTAYGSSSNVSNRTAPGAPSTGAATTVSGAILGSAFDPAGNPYLQHSDDFYPAGYSAVDPNLSNDTFPTDTGTDPGSHSHATNDTAIGKTPASNRNAANDTDLTAQLISNPPILRSNFSPPVLDPLTGRTRWPCIICGKDFSRQADVVRHAKTHSEKFPYQCDVPGCNFKGSHRMDNLARHKLRYKH